MSRLSRSFFIVAFFFGLEKIFGYLRYILIARQFGYSLESDAYYVANNVPDLILALISGGALAVAFIPVLSEYLDKGGRPALWELFSKVANLVFLVSATLSIIVAILAVPLVKYWIAPGFNPAEQVLAANLMRVNLLATFMLSIGGLIIAGLQANQYFFLPALAPVMYDLGALFGVVVLAPAKSYEIYPFHIPSFGMGIYGVMLGTVIGAALFVLIQVPGLVRYKFRWKPVLSLHDTGVIKVLSLMGPRVLTAAFIYFIFIAQENIAYRLATGSVSFINYGWLFQQVPETIIGTAIATALLPTISELFARQDRTGFQLTLNQSLRVILALTIPIGLLIAIGIPPFVSILGGSAADQATIVWVTRAFLFGLTGQAMLEVSSRAFYAQQKALVPLITSFITLLIFIGLGILLGFRWAAPGIGLANSLAFTIEGLLLWALLRRNYPGILQVGRTLLRVVPISIVSAVLLFIITQFLGLSMISVMGGFVICALLVLPFIWPEIKLLFRLGA
jgi:putative peptidoglycan lipid II flippase